MRLASDDYDPGFETYCDIIMAGLGVTVLCDGVMLDPSTIIMVDEKKGIVEVASNDEDGKPVWLKGTRASKFLTGKIQILTSPRTVC